MSYKTTFIALLAGVLFGAGLLVSGMGSPAKVQAFLDIGGVWDPSLLIVMAVAVTISALVFRCSRSNDDLASDRGVDRRLLCGAALFGVGWGIAGICPGPAFVLIGKGAQGGLVFTLAMFVGMSLFEVSRRFGRV